MPELQLDHQGHLRYGKHYPTRLNQVKTSAAAKGAHQHCLPELVCSDQMDYEESDDDLDEKN